MESIKKVFQKAVRYWPVFAGLILIIIGLGIFQILRSDKGSEDTPGITTSTITTGDIRLSAYGSGTLIAADEVFVGFEYEGVVDEILVEVGDTVQEGDILVKLYDEELQDELAEKEADLRELTSDATVAAAALELAEAQKDVLSAESTLSFYLSPYVYKSEIRLRNAQNELISAFKETEENPSDGADQRAIEAQEAVDHAELSLALNWETYYEEYVPDFFNFPWRDLFGFWHDYFDPPSEIEVDQVLAELAVAEARVEEAEYYLAAMTEGSISEDAYGSKVTALEKVAESVAEAMEKLEAASLTAPLDGVVLKINLTKEQSIGTTKVITIARLDPPTLEASFDEGDWSLVKVGFPVEIIFDTLPEKGYRGQIIFVDPTLQTRQNTTTVSALVELDVTETGWANLPLLSAATVEVIAGEVKDAILLPVDCLQEDNGDQGLVNIVHDGGETIQKEVEIGLRDVLYVEITEGLSVGDVVVIKSFE